MCRYLATLAAWLKEIVSAMPSALDVSRCTPRKNYCIINGAGVIWNSSLLRPAIFFRANNGSLHNGEATVFRSIPTTRYPLTTPV
jgi:hypothetical protein